MIKESGFFVKKQDPKYLPLGEGETKHSPLEFVELMQCCRFVVIF